MKLSVLLNHLTTENIPNITIKQITNDSRQLTAGCLFLAEQGIGSHGLDHLTLAQCQQAAAVAYQQGYDVSRFSAYQNKMIAVEGLNACVSEIGKRFYQPQFSQTLIGVTGTNGKTSVTHFIAQLSDYAVIGTMGYGNIGQLQALSHTTPDALSVQKILAQLAVDNVGVAMEISSHALSLHRVAAVDFSVAVFTNLSQDHLDFHTDMDDYFTAKAKLFDFETVKAAVINTDDDFGYRLAKKIEQNGQRVLAYGHNKRVKGFAESVFIPHVDLSALGVRATLEINVDSCKKTRAWQAPLWGAFNVDNAVAAVLALYAGGQDLPTLLDKATLLRGVCGRIDAIDLGDNKTAIIDYSHTPDALDNVLQSLRQHTQNSIYVVFGCGGDRDKSKRPLMAQAVNQGADWGIVTDDNPRTERSEDIIADILTADIDKTRFQVIASRREAIRFALNKMTGGDIVLIAGKGHEDYQIIGTEKIHFSDHEVVHEWLAETKA